MVTRRLQLQSAAAAILASAVVGQALAGDLPVSGRPTPGLSQFDTLMQTFLDDTGVDGAVLGIMRNGVVVYLKGFGEDYDGNNLPENTPFRLASCSKPITIAAVRQRIAAGDFELGTRVFNLNGNGGLLSYAPFPSLGDSRLQNITVQHLISHLGGWDRAAVPDLTYRETEIADDMGVDSPPGRGNTIRWILGQPLQFTPGSTPGPNVDNYSNIGCLALGLVVESETGQSMVSYVRNNVLTPNMWVPSTELFQARTFRDDQNPREPEYAGEGLVWSVFEFGVLVYKPYGGFDVEARIGQGGYVCSAPTMLEFLNRYHCGSGNGNALGRPIDDDFPLNSTESHSGSQAGVNTIMVQRTDGINVFLAFNERDSDDGEHYASDFYNDSLKPELDAGGIAWPTAACDGAWVSPGGLVFGGIGGYNRPYLTFSYAVSAAANGTKLRVKAGTSNFVGTINKRMLIDAPLGTVTIGQ